MFTYLSYKELHSLTELTSHDHTRKSRKIVLIEQFRGLMDLNKLIAIVTIILTLSIAAERLVEIVKGLFSSWFTSAPPSAFDANGTLTNTQEIAKAETRRLVQMHLLSLACSLITALLATPILASIFKDLFNNSACQPLAYFSATLGEVLPCGGVSLNGLFLTLSIGLLASGGSSLWNSILEYLIKVKDLKKVEVSKLRIETETARTRLMIERNRLK